MGGGGGQVELSGHVAIFIENLLRFKNIFCTTENNLITKYWKTIWVDSSKVLDFLFQIVLLQCTVVTSRCLQFEM